ncbi:putative transcription factor and/or regulators TTF-type(Zn) family [Medicago truncatula]|uniref:Putative transcription factor and/or regulators TTF-type(Zn) family n=1 Tax=Medicago truncatula TaxID=3880 RepID=A0A396IUK6_MEDTR|nr:putative transcription factor and/or regulators TTF-type(Zn) family [Medicago truncatula]
MRKFLVDRTRIENVNVVQPETEVEEPPPNVVNEFNPNEIVRDPGLRKQIWEYAPDIQDQVRRAYILKGPTQPNSASFPRTQFGRDARSFSRSWYNKYTWIEYSESKDAAYCFYCFLFKQPGRAEHFGYEVFNKDGFKDWKHASQGLKDHIGGHNSMHNKCIKHYDDYKNQRQSVTSKIARATRESEELYKIRLTCSLDCTKFLVSQGISFRGHDETSNSLNKGNFRELIDWEKSKNEQVRDAFDRGGKNCKMTCGDIQKDLAMSCAHEVMKVITEELGDKQFSVLIDESRDISVKEQMAVMLRFLNDKGEVVERYFALYHVKDTTSEALKNALYDILDRYTLSISRIRGQGYDGASNMRGEFNGLQRKILDENPYAFYVHCYAHRLQLVIVSVASSCSSINDFFEYISFIVTTSSASCKRMDALTEVQHEDILSKLSSGEISTGRGLNQSCSLARPGDTRWGSHHITLLRLDQMWSSVLVVLSMVDKDGRGPSQAAGLIEKMESFKFVFILKLMLKLFGITNELSKILQRKDLNIVLAMDLINVVKSRFATLRDNGWDNLFLDVQEFCVAKGIPVPNMDDEIPVRGRSRLEGRTVTNLHHYRAEIFYVAIDKICVEMDHRFSEGSNIVLDCFSCLDPQELFLQI